MVVSFTSRPAWVPGHSGSGLTDMSGSPMEHAYCSMGVNINVNKTVSPCFISRTCLSRTE